MSKPCVTGVCFPVSYVDDYEKAFAFYTQVLGLEKSFPMGDDQCFLKMGEQTFGLLLVGGAERRTESGEDFTQASYVLRTASAREMMAALRAAGAKVVQDEPVDMGDGDWWFQFFDPAGNLLQILGGA